MGGSGSKCKSRSDRAQRRGADALTPQVATAGMTFEITINVRRRRAGGGEGGKIMTEKLKDFTHGSILVTLVGRDGPTATLWLLAFALQYSRICSLRWALLAPCGASAVAGERSTIVLYRWQVGEFGCVFPGQPSLVNITISCSATARAFAG